MRFYQTSCVEESTESVTVPAAGVERYTFTMRIEVGAPGQALTPPTVRTGKTLAA
jgi:hypothetical protein